MCAEDSMKVDMNSAVILVEALDQPSSLHGEANSNPPAWWGGLFTDRSAVNPQCVCSTTSYDFNHSKWYNNSKSMCCSWCSNCGRLLQILLINEWEIIIFFGASGWSHIEGHTSRCTMCVNTVTTQQLEQMCPMTRPGQRVPVLRQIIPKYKYAPVLTMSHIDVLISWTSHRQSLTSLSMHEAFPRALVHRRCRGDDNRSGGFLCGAVVMIGSGLMKGGGPCFLLNSLSWDGERQHLRFHCWIILAGWYCWTCSKSCNFILCHFCSPENRFSTLPWKERGSSQRASTWTYPHPHIQTQKHTEGWVRRPWAETGCVIGVN